MTDKKSTSEHEAEFHLADLAILWGELRASTRTLGTIYSKLMWANLPDRRRVRRPDRFFEIGERMAQLDMQIAGIQDEIGAIINEKVAEDYGEDDD